MSDLLVEGAVPTGGDADAQELSQAAEWFSEQGFPVPPELTMAPGAVQGEPETPPEEPEAPVPPVEEPPEPSPQAKGWETRREGLKKAYETVQSDFRQEKQYNEALLQVVKELHAKLNGKAAPPAAEAPPEEEPDIIDSPDKFVQARIEKALEPYKKAIGVLLGRNKQMDEEDQVSVMVSQIEGARMQYEQTNPGFVARAKEYRESFVDDLQETGMSAEEADAAFINSVNGLMYEAMRRGNNPIAVLDRIASRYASYGPTQPPQTPQNGTPKVPQSVRAAAGDKIAAAMRAANSGATRPGPSVGNAGDSEEGPVTMQDIRNGRVRPQDVKKLLSQPGGTEKFWQLAKAIEEEG